METISSVAYIGGCGRLGLSLAAWSAECGLKVIVADINEDAVKMVSKGQCPISEPGVAELIKNNYGKRLFATTSTKDAVLASEIICVIVPTPSRPSGEFSVDFVVDACEEVGKALAETDKYKVVIICSTVNPGDTRGPIKKALEEESGKKMGVGFFCTYSPEFIRQGEIVHDFANPHQILIGASDRVSADVALEYYRCVVKNNATVQVMSLESAEIAKIGLNAAVVTKTTVANQLMWLSHYTPHADSRDVLRAVGADPRIGRQYFGGGPPVGGECFPRDTRALQAAIDGTNSVMAHSKMMTGVSKSAAYEISEILTIVGEHEGSVGVLGLAFKPGVDITTESAGATIARTAQHNNGPLKREVWAYDPLARVEGINQTESIEQLVDLVDIIVITLPWHKEIDDLAEMDMHGKVVIDLWGHFQMLEETADKYIRIGRGKE